MLRTARARALALQVGAVVLTATVLLVVFYTAAGNLAARGIPFGLDFLWNRAGFTITESILPYSPNDSNLWAIAVGVGNTLWISAIVSVVSTFLGSVLALARIGSNPLLSALAKVWIEAVRNTPVLLLLLFVYTLWWAIPAGDHYQLVPGLFVSMRGIAFPRLEVGVSGGAIAAVAAGCVATLWMARRMVVRQQQRGDTPLPWTAIVAAVQVLALASIAVAFRDHIAVDWPRPEGNALLGGMALTPELATILVGLTLYTTGFIAEIVRAGLQAVPKGQWEAARALGLPARRVLSLVVIPQMLRVVFPPMTSQYINVIKNSTLAIVVGYAEFMTVMGTIINKTSHAIEGTVIMVVVYLLINLSLSAVLNWYNRRADFGGR